MIMLSTYPTTYGMTLIILLPLILPVVLTCMFTCMFAYITKSPAFWPTCGQSKELDFPDPYKTWAQPMSPLLPLYPIFQKKNETILQRQHSRAYLQPHLHFLSGRGTGQTVVSLPTPDNKPKHLQIVVLLSYNFILHPINPPANHPAPRPAVHEPDNGGKCSVLGASLSFSISHKRQHLVQFPNVVASKQ